MKRLTEETHPCLTLEDGTRYTVTLESTQLHESVIWSVWVTRINRPGLGQCRRWEVYGIDAEPSARLTANLYWTSIKRDGKRP